MAEDAGTRAVPLAEARPALRVAEARGQAFVSLGLGGVAWTPLEGLADAPPMGSPDDAGRAFFREDWPTLAVAEFGADEVILAGRDGRLRVLAPTGDTGGWMLRVDWPVEGIPTGVAERDGLIAVGAGGAGLGLWQWGGDATVAPRLVGRYPFIGFGKDVAFLADDRLAVADAFLPGVVEVSVADPLRPHRIRDFRGRSFCDALDWDGRALTFSDRNTGFYHAHHYDRDTGLTGTVFLPLDPGDGRALGTHYRDGILVLAQGTGGVRVMEDRGGEGWHQVAHVETPAATSDALILANGRALLAMNEAGVAVIDLPLGDAAGTD